MARSHSAPCRSEWFNALPLFLWHLCCRHFILWIHLTVRGVTLISITAFFLGLYLSLLGLTSLGYWLATSLWAQRLISSIAQTDYQSDQTGFPVPVSDPWIHLIWTIDTTQNCGVGSRVNFPGLAVVSDNFSQVLQGVDSLTDCSSDSGFDFISHYFLVRTDRSAQFAPWTLDTTISDLCLIWCSISIAISDFLQRLTETLLYSLQSLSRSLQTGLSFPTQADCAGLVGVGSLFDSLALYISKFFRWFCVSQQPGVGSRDRSLAWQTRQIFLDWRLFINIFWKQALAPLSFTVFQVSNSCVRFANSDGVGSRTFFLALFKQFGFNGTAWSPWNSVIHDFAILQGVGSHIISLALGIFITVFHFNFHAGVGPRHHSLAQWNIHFITFILVLSFHFGLVPGFNNNDVVGSRNFFLALFTQLGFRGTAWPSWNSVFDSLDKLQGVGSHSILLALDTIAAVFQNILIFHAGVGPRHLSLAQWTLQFNITVLVFFFIIGLALFLSITSRTRRVFASGWTGWNIGTALPVLHFALHTAEHLQRGLEWFLPPRLRIASRGSLRGRKPGPKSRRLLRVYCLIFCTGITIASACMTVGRGEGCTPAMGSAETSYDWTNHFINNNDVKLHGSRPPECAHAHKRLNPRNASQVVKRSLFRAQRRAHKMGLTWYKGKSMVPDDFIQMGMPPLDQKVTSTKPHDLKSCHLSHRPKRRMPCFHWNGNGLSASKLDEIKHWLSLQQIKIAVLTETRWSFTSTWSDTEWHHVHSCDPDHRGAGVLILISNSLSTEGDIRWNEVVPGRLLHVRIMNTTRCIDVLGCYQHVFNREKDHLKRRETFWNALGHQLNLLPSRNTVVVVGDFNCCLHASEGTCGSSQYAWKHRMIHGTCHSDNDRFLNTLRSGGLVALNSWNAQLGPLYIHQGHSSRIDHAFTRHQHADGGSRDVQYLWDAPFVPPGKCGHAPMLFHVALYWIPPMHHSRHRLTPAQRALGRQAKLANHPDWQNFLLQSEETIRHAFHTAWTSDCLELQTVHDVAMEQFSQAFPAVSKCVKSEPWQDNPVTLTKWAHRAKAVQSHARDTRGFFHAWFHIARFLHLKRSHQRFAAKIRKQRFEETLRQASIAANQHNTHKLFDIINRHAPRIPRRRMQLRNSQGSLMTVSEERSMLVAFVRSTWTGDPIPTSACTTPPGVPFTISELCEALRMIPTGKAVAQPCAPGLIWNSLSEAIAPALYGLLTKWWGTCNPWIPRMWRSGWLQLIPKPNKPPTKPSNLRPLAIQCPLGKAVLGILIKHAAWQTDAEFRRWPIWAFMSLRSTQDPLTKVAAHCRETQNLIRCNRSNPHTRAFFQETFTCFGGLQVFVDLEKAFDSVNRAKLFSKLHTLHIDDALICLLRHWHIDTEYIVTHGGESSVIPVNRGLRQGCKGAPYLWNSLLVLIMHELRNRIPMQWILAHVSLYADDIHVGGTFTSVAAFQQLLAGISALISTLREFDLQINPQKSTALLTMHGHQGRKLRARHVKKNALGEHLIICLDNTEVHIPIQKSAVYLGCIMSYHNFADSTLWHRVKLARVGFARLRRWLCSRSHFTISQRFNLWRTCILPIMTYGVFAVGVTQHGIKHMLTQIGIMIRSIVRDHAHHTGNSNEQVFNTFSVPHPTALLTAAVTTLQRSIAQRNLLIASDDITHSLSWDHLESIHVTIAHAQAALSRHHIETALSVEVPGHDALYACQLCGFCTNHVSAFRRHSTAVHKIPMYRRFDHAMHSYCTDGLPTCKYCQQSFATWRYFRIHIQRGCQALCPGPDATVRRSMMTNAGLTLPSIPASVRGTSLLQATDLAHLQSMPWGPRVLQILADNSLDRLEHDVEAFSYLSKYCFICGQHAHRIQDMSLHFRSEHPQFWDHVADKARMLTNVHSSEPPCTYCGSGFRTHQCPFWTQIACLILHGGGLPLDDASAEASARRCDICFEIFPDAAALSQHLRTHKLPGVSFNVARDSIASQSACSHCGMAFSSMESLRSHISQGRCAEFNVAAAPETSEITEAWKSLCLHGEMYSQLQPPMVRLRMTVRCCHCHQAYQRACDLANHLMTSHAKLWRQAQGLTLLLVELVFARLGCVCNPQLHQVRQGHICLPLRQIAMMYHRLDQVPFMPIQLHENVLHQLVHPSIPRQLKFRLTQLFADRNFSALWTEPEVMKLLSTACVMCGQEHRTGLLCRHLHEAHSCGHQFAEFYMDTLLPAMTSIMQSDFKCDFCLQIFNLPFDPNGSEERQDRFQLVQTHLQGNCPVFLQASVLLGTALNGGRLGDEWMGCGSMGPNPRDVRPFGTSPGQVPETPGESQSSEATQNSGNTSGKHSRSRSTRTRSTGKHPAVHEGAGAASAQTRAQSELAAKHRLFHTVLPAGQGGSIAWTPSGDTTMATAPTEEPGRSDTTAEAAPMPMAPEGAPSESNQDLGMQAGRPVAAGVPGKEVGAGRHELAVFQMGQRPEDHGPGQEESCHHAEDAPTSGRTVRGSADPKSDRALPGAPH